MLTKKKKKSMSSQQLLDKIDNYLLGKMDDADLSLFEEELTIDLSLKKEVEKQKQLLEALYLHEEYISLKKELKNIEADNYSSTKILNSSKQKQPKTRFLFLMGAAASVALVVSLVTFFTVNWSISNRGTGNYALLSEEVKDLSTKQKSLQELVHDIVEKDRGNGTREWIGTCFPLTKDGFLVTSYHLVGRAKKIKVELSTGKLLNAEVVHKDVAHDLALLFIDDTLFSGFNKLPYGLSKSTSLLGSDVYTLGYPKKTIVYNEGTVSSLSGYRDDSLSYQLSIPVNPGNSGAPVFDKHGNIIGIIHGKHTENEGVAFAIKSTYLLSAVENMENFELIRAKIAKRSSISYRDRTSQIKSITPYILRLKVSR